jgi:eukaryotic-like serine/threonine-protein kinase
VLGKTISHYRVVEAIGKGGMGVVYRAEDERLGRHVALKFLPEELSDDKQALERFKREARAASALNHPNICTIYDVGEADGRSFIAMEFLEGENLQRRIAARPSPGAEILEIGLQLAGALDAAHSKGIVHRDIKPANIIVDAQGHAKLLDFGLASIERRPTGPSSGMTATVMPAEGLTSPGTALGTAAYMAPEQARGEDLDARCDLFSFGAVLYEMCTGTPAFGGATLALIFDNILHKEPRSPEQLNPSLVPGLEQVVMKALAKDREERYQSAADMRADLRRLRRESESGKAAAVVEPPGRRQWLYAGLGLVAAAVIVASGVGAYLYHVRRSSAPVASQTEWVPVTNFADSAVSPALSADGRMLAFIRGSDTFFGSGQVYAKLLPDGEPVQLTRDDANKMSPAFSPDGSRIAYGAIGGGWDTWVVPVLGGEHRPMLANAEGLTWIDTDNLLFSEIQSGMHMQLVTARDNRSESRIVYAPSRERGMVHRSALSPDRQWVLVAQMDNGGFQPCLVVPFAGDSGSRQVGPKDGGCTHVAWSPDGAWMYFSSDAGGRFHIWRQRFPDGAPQQVTSGATEEEGMAIAPDGRSLITSVGSVQSTVMIHDAKGERQISSENFAESPQFSPDGKYIYYLVPPRGAAGSQFTSGRLVRADLEAGNNEPLLPGFEMSWYSPTPDGRRVVFSAKNAQGHDRLWVADLNLRSSPQQFATTVDEDHPSVDAAGNIYFRAVEGGLNFLYRMKADGSGREKALATPIFEFDGISPDGRWAVVVQGSSKSQDVPFETILAPLDGGPSLKVCSNFCDSAWGNQGKVFAVHLRMRKGGKTVLLPVESAGGKPRLPSVGFDPITDSETGKGAKAVDKAIVPGPNAGQYAWLSESAHRNLYRIPLQ